MKEFGSILAAEGPTRTSGRIREACGEVHCATDFSDTCGRCDFMTCSRHPQDMRLIQPIRVSRPQSGRKSVERWSRARSNRLPSVSDHPPLPHRKRQVQILAEDVDDIGRTAASSRG
jgi:hypothetical protein